MGKRNGREKGIKVSYVACSSRNTVLERVGKLWGDKKLAELFPRDKKCEVDDGVYAELKRVLASGLSLSGSRLFAEADLFCSFFCYRCVRAAALTRSLLVLTSDRELDNVLNCVALLCDYCCREDWPLTEVECKLLLLGLLYHNARLDSMPVIEWVMEACTTETVGAVPRLTRSS